MPSTHNREYTWGKGYINVFDRKTWLAAWGFSLQLQRIDVPRENVDSKNKRERYVFNQPMSCSSMATVSKLSTLVLVTITPFLPVYFHVEFLLAHHIYTVHVYLRTFDVNNVIQL